MIDWRFDWGVNDIILTGNNFEETNFCSPQNASLIFFKSPASITRAQFGIGFGSLYANLPEIQFPIVAAKGEQQVKNDGATTCTITMYYSGMNKDYDVEIRAIYPQEQNAILR